MTAQLPVAELHHGRLVRDAEDLLQVGLARQLLHTGGTLGQSDEVVGAGLVGTGDAGGLAQGGNARQQGDKRVSVTGPAAVGVQLPQIRLQRPDGLGQPGVVGVKVNQSCLRSGGGRRLGLGGLVLFLEAVKETHGDTLLSVVLVDDDGVPFLGRQVDKLDEKGHLVLLVQCGPDVLGPGLGALGGDGHPAGLPLEGGQGL